ncbi:nuclease-related domain-containing protein [Leifsonia aquatica]|uniref:nuclease-related domain-containing protein n=1 Tax=Leifsonia aquatica TaxID=144185 RepID=UPI0038058EA2
MGDEGVGQPAIQTTRVDFAGIQALTSRPAGYAVALKCLQVQAEAIEREPGLRSEKRELLHADAWSWYQGARGEIEVGAMLDTLGPGWFVRHSVPIGAGTKDVDHLVIGPGGVFAINTKHHAGASVWVGDYTLRVNNANTPHLRAARSDGLDVARRLAAKTGFPVPVTPVVAILNARSFRDARASNARDVAVIQAPALIAWLRAQHSLLGATKTDLIALAAEEPGTWHVDPRAADTLRAMQRFERLVARVEAVRPPASTLSGATPRKPRPATTRTKPTSRPRSVRPGLVRLWLATAFVVGAILVFRGIANQPCASPVACLVPAFYLAWKPLLIVGALVVVARAVFLTFTKPKGMSASKRKSR